MAASEDICNPISTGELERRWRAVRDAMAERGIDVLLMQAANSFHGGYVRWFTDVPAVNGGYVTVVFPRDEPMTVVRQGPPGERLVADDDPVDRGVGRVLTAPTFAAVDYKRHLAADLVVAELGSRMPATIGLVGTGSMSSAFADRIRDGRLAGARFVDATEAVDAIKAVKSAEEIGRIRATAAMQDAILAQVLEQVRPGRRAFELTALARHVGEDMGSEEGMFLCGSRPLGRPGHYAVRHMQGRPLREGDQLALVIENSGPGGYYCELGRTCVLGRASAELRDEFAFALEAQRLTRELLRPGARPAEVLVAHNDFMREHGRPEERRLHAHGQGQDVVERPLVCAEETLVLAAGMNVAVHPEYVTDTVHSWVSDNVLITADGGSERLHRTPQRIFEV